MPVTPPPARDKSDCMDAFAQRFDRYRRHGDLAALGEVFDALAPRLLPVAMHLCGNPEDAEDALQQTFVLAIEHANAFDATRRLEPWLAGLLTNVARNARRGEARRAAKELPDIADPDVGPLATAERAELVKLLRTHVDELPVEQRQVLHLQLQHGLSAVEVAEALAVPAGTVRMRVHRGLQALRRLLPASLAVWFGAALAPRGLAAVRHAVLGVARAKVAAVGAGTTAATSVAVLGGTMAIKKTVAVVAVLGVCGLLWWNAMSPAAPASGASGDARAALASATVGANDSSPADGLRRDAAANVASREEVATTAAGTAADVLVVRFGTDEPIAGAEVLSLPPDFDQNELSPEMRELANHSHEDAFLRRVGVHATSGGDGHCRVAFGARGVRVVARLGEMRAEGWLQASTPQPLVLALRPDCTLHARVVYADGRPAPGVRVISTRRVGVGDDLGVTDARGALSYGHLQQLAGAAPTMALDLRATFPVGESDAVTIEATDPPSEVVLRLPPCGSVIVHVRDANGRPLDPALVGNPSVRLGVWKERPADRNAESDGLNRTQANATFDELGNATFPAVVLDHVVMVASGMSMRSLVVAGPTLREPRVEIVLQESPETVIFTGVLRDPEDRALVSGYTVTRHSNDGGMSSSNGRTDGDGRFRIDLGMWGAGQRSTIDVAAAPGDGRRRFAIELPARDVTHGINDLGTLRLTPFSLLVQGRVVGAEDSRMLHLQFERHREGAWQGEWNLQPEWSGPTFSVQSGVPAGTRMRLVLRTSAFLPLEPIEFVAGATGVEVPVQRAGSATATFLADPDVPLHSLWVVLQRTDAPDSREDRPGWVDRLSTGRAADGTMKHQWRGLASGTYRLEVHCPGGARPLVELDAITIGDGPCKDARLDGIDLRGRLRVLRIGVTAADGSVVASAEAFVVVRGQKEWRGYNLGEREATIVAAEAVDLLVVAPGQRAAFIDGVFESRTIALEAAPPTQLVFALPTPVPEGLRVRVWLKPKVAIGDQANLLLDSGRGMYASDFFRQDLVVDPDGKLPVNARCPGVHRLSVSIGTDARSSSLDVAPYEVTLPANADVAVRIDAASWKSALQKLAK